MPLRAMRLVLAVQDKATGEVPRPVLQETELVEAGSDEPEAKGDQQVSHPHDPDRVFDSAMGEVTTQAEDGTVLSVEAKPLDLKPELDALYVLGKRVGLIRAASMVHDLYERLMAEAEKK